jgi:phenylalanyl-tRNA synthetase beta subunit
LPSQSRDISFYVSQNTLENVNGKDKWLIENTFFELLRDNSDELIEQVKLLDTFYNKKVQKHSRTYRVTYSSNDINLKDSAEFTTLVNTTQDKIRHIISQMNLVELR